MRAAVAGMLAMVAAVTSLLGGGQHSVARGSAAAPAAAARQPSAALLAIPRDPAQLASALAAAQQTVDDQASPSAALQNAGEVQQLAAVRLTGQSPRSQRAVLTRLSGRAAASLRSDLAAARALHRLNQPRHSLPAWKIVAPPAPATLLGYFKAAQSRYGVPWQYLAAIELIETDFGRVAGLSSAGAEGPMQFMPATWAEYGTGNVHDPRQAILGAARYLASNGAPGDMPGAVYHYNPSRDYVAAVRAYATRITADPRAFHGYYYWQVILARVGGLEVLPVGFPKVRPLRLTF